MDMPYAEHRCQPTSHVSRQGIRHPMRTQVPAVSSSELSQRKQQSLHRTMTWKQMQIANPTAYQKEQLADQQWIF